MCIRDRHGIVEDQTGRISGLGNYIENQEDDPGGSESKADTADHADSQYGDKQFFLIVLRVRQTSEGRP